MRDMANIYRFCTTGNLKLNLSRKRRMLEIAERGFSNWEKRDARELRYHIKQIEVELESRALQQKLSI